MRIRVARGAPPMGPSWSLEQIKTFLEIDIDIPISQDFNDVGTSSCGIVDLESETAQQGAPLQPVTIDVDSLDDDVILCSPRAFAEAKNKSRRNQVRTNVVDVELESQAGHKRRRAQTNQPYINLEGNGDSMQVNGKNLSQLPRGAMRPHSPPPEPTFSCPICLGPFVEETSTKCGHIFCNACIKKSIAAQGGKCPTCRKKVTMKTTFRIYLPATRSS